MREILKIRSEEEDVSLDEDALQYLAQLSKEASLRYAMQLITTGSLVAAKDRCATVGLKHLKRVYDLFYDEKRSAQHVDMHHEHYMFHHVDDSGRKSALYSNSAGGDASSVGDVEMLAPSGPSSLRAASGDAATDAMNAD